MQGHRFEGAGEGAKASERQIWERVEGTRSFGGARRGRWDRDGFPSGMKEWRRELRREGAYLGVSEKATDLGEGQEVLANGWEGELGAKAKYLEDEHIFRVKGARALWL